MVNFGNLTTTGGLSSLNDFLAERSYIEGFTPSQADVAVFEALGAAAPPASLANALRWHTHIASYGTSELTKLPGVKPTLDTTTAAAAPAKAAADEDEDDDDDVDLFGSDNEEEDAEAERIRAERIAAYSEKKSHKPALIAKSQILLDVKPWGDETDMKEVEKSMRSIVMDGLTWGAGELKPMSYGLMKLTILATVIDAKVSVDDLTEKMEEFEDLVQSVDIAAFNKL